MYIMCDPPRIYLFLPEYTPPPPSQQLYATLPEYTLPSQNIPPLFNKCICATLPEYTPPSLPPRIHPPFQQLNATFPESTPLSTTIILCDAPRMYPSLPEYTPPPFQQLYMTLPESTPPFQNIPTFQQLYYYTTLPEYFPPSISPRIYPPSFNNYMRHSQKLPLPPRIPPLFFRQIYAPFPLKIYPSSPFYNYMRYSKNIALSH